MYKLSKETFVVLAMFEVIKRPFGIMDDKLSRDHYAIIYSFKTEKAKARATKQNTLMKQVLTITLLFIASLCFYSCKKAPELTINSLTNIELPA